MTHGRPEPRQFSLEEKAKVVRDNLFFGRSIPSICKDLGISRREFRQWEKEFDDNIRAKMEAESKSQAELNRARKREQKAKSLNPMRIRDIAVGEVRRGMNWRVVYPDAESGEGFLREDLEIEPLGEYTPDDTLVYSGIRVYLKDLGEPRTGLFLRLTGRARMPRDCRCPPEDPKDLAPGIIPAVEPILMVKEACSEGWDYCFYVDGKWRQPGLDGGGKAKSNRHSPRTHEYIANPVDEDPEFDACGDDGPIREWHKRGFWNWSKYLEG